MNLKVYFQFCKKEHPVLSLLYVQPYVPKNPLGK